MTQGKHTSGPWVVVARTDYHVARITDQDGEPVAFTSAMNRQSEANAHLLAAAPDLLGELKRMVEHFEVFASDHSMEASTETWSALHCAKAAIAKAEGRR